MTEYEVIYKQTEYRKIKIPAESAEEAVVKFDDYFHPKALDDSPEGMVLYEDEGIDEWDNDETAVEVCVYNDRTCFFDTVWKAKDR